MVALVRRTAPPVSAVVLSDDEAAAAVREANAGQPTQWIDDAVAQELRERADLQRWAQTAYDKHQPSRPYKTED